MSREVHVQFAVKSRAIMKQVLADQGIQFQEQGERIVVARNYHNIVFDTSSGQVSYDDMDRRQVNAIQQAYSVAFYKDEVIREGMQLREERHADGTVTLHLYQ